MTKKSDVVDTAKSIAMASAKVALVAGGVGGIEAAVFAGGFDVFGGLGLSLAKRAFEAQAERKFGRWIEGVARELKYGSVEDAHAAILGTIDAPDSEAARAGIMAAARAIFDDIEEVAIPYLARVTALQIEGKRVDRRDRNIVALLRELDANTFPILQGILCDCLSHAKSYESIGITLFRPGSEPPMPPPTECEEEWTFWISARDAKVYEGEAYEVSCAPEGLRRVLTLLERTGLFTVVPKIGADQYSVSSSELVDYLWPRLRPVEI